MMGKLIAKNVDTNVKLVMTNGLVPSVLDQTEIPHLIVTVLQDIMKTQIRSVNFVVTDVMNVLTVPMNVPYVQQH